MLTLPYERLLPIRLIVEWPKIVREGRYKNACYDSSVWIQFIKLYFYHNMYIILRVILHYKLLRKTEVCTLRIYNSERVFKKKIRQFTVKNMYDNGRQKINSYDAWCNLTYDMHNVTRIGSSSTVTDIRVSERTHISWIIIREESFLVRDNICTHTIIVRYVHIQSVKGLSDQYAAEGLLRINYDNRALISITSSACQTVCFLHRWTKAILKQKRSCRAANSIILQMDGHIKRKLLATS